MIEMMRLIRLCYESLYDDEGKERDEPNGFLYKRKLDQERIEFLRCFYRLILNPKVLSENTRIFIRSGEGSIKQVVHQYNLSIMNESTKKPIKASTMNSSLVYDVNRKLLVWFDKDMLDNIVLGRQVDINRYYAKLYRVEQLIICKQSMLDNILLDLSRSEYREELSDQDFDELIMIIAPFIKSHVRFIEQNILNSYVGYLNFLAAGKLTTDLQKEHYRRLSEFLLV